MAQNEDGTGSQKHSNGCLSSSQEEGLRRSRGAPCCSQPTFFGNVGTAIAARSRRVVAQKHESLILSQAFKQPGCLSLGLVVFSPCHAIDVRRAMSSSDNTTAAVGFQVAVDAVANHGSEPTAPPPMQPTSATKEAQSTASESSAEEKTTRNPPPILCLGMARTGSASLAKALNILGIGKVHHGLDMKGDEYEYQWRILDRAADCVFPNVATYTGEPFGRADWGECFGGYDAVTDLASFFALPLIAAYPDARVILVERDVEHWLPSIELVFAPWQKASVRRFTRWLPRWSETVSGVACGKIFEGWARSERPEDLMKCARVAYERHYREIRAAVPPGQLLDLRLADGWEPLCRFLGKEVPEEPFPHINNAAAYKENYRSEAKRILKHAAKRMFLPCFA